jgi:phenylpyruvate tautomerase PptA (4-oxalocrotonate tautomerase family)
MPYLKVSTNVAVSGEQAAALTKQLSQQLAKETGKPERYVMIELSGGNTMLFGGGSEPLAFLKCKSIGLGASQAKSLSAALCRTLNEALKISSDRIYIEFGNCPAEFWGWNGATFG